MYTCTLHSLLGLRHLGSGLYLINMNNHVQSELPSNDLKPFQSPLFHGMPVLDGMSFRRKYVTGGDHQNECQAKGSFIQSGRA